MEIVFHESSHGMMDKLRAALRAAETNWSHSQNRQFDAGTLWHAILFYTAGELVVDRIPGYVPYADQNGLWVRAWPSPDRALIEQDWKPHIKGSLQLEPALTKLVEDIASAQQRPAIEHNPGQSE